MKATKLSIRSILQMGGLAVLLPIAGAATAQDALFVDSTGQVGVGTSAPASPLHVQTTTGAQLRVEITDTAGDGTNDVMFRLRNHSADIIRFIIKSATASWSFDNAGNLFRIAKVGGSTTPEFTVDGSGNGTFRGSLTATTFNQSSSRALKTDFSPVSEATLLDKVSALDISQWRYKTEPANAQHIGPMAEEFQAVFGLGDGKHIATVDEIGIALAAIQALEQENDQLRARLAKLEAAIAK